ncbi:MAG: sigma-54-dependent Fis family transcriptional regulator [Pirellulales bacterium]
MQLLLDVWREVCRHIEIHDSVARLAPLLAGRLPADFVLFRRLDSARHCLETAAVAACRPGLKPELARTDCSAEQMERVLSWARMERVLHCPAGVADDPAAAALVPPGLGGDVLAGPLVNQGGPLGVLLVVAGSPRVFSAAHVALVQSLLEPFAVALQNDWRIREIKSLREAVEADNRALLSRLDRQDISDSIVGAETGLRSVMERVELVAHSDAPVLVIGETGSGKEVVARAIHKLSRRAAGPILRVNCGAIPTELVDSELFGHERGSFTGAVATRQGWFERADGGTLFLDEIGELPLAAQVRLLRILQDGSFERVGGEQPLSADVRIIAATHRDLASMVHDGRFREDLWYRIGVFPIYLPPLRDRVEDIPSLATHFALRSAKRLGVASLVPLPGDIALLVSYSWPGNIRELAAVIERAAILGNGQHLEVAKALGVSQQAAMPRNAELLVAAGSPAPAAPPLVSLDLAMARHIEAALTATRGRVEGPYGAAAILGINPHTLRARMRKLGVNWNRFRPAP